MKEITANDLNHWIVEWLPEEEIITEDAEFEVVELKQLPNPVNTKELLNKIHE